MYIASLQHPAKNNKATSQNPIVLPQPCDDTGGVNADTFNDVYHPSDYGDFLRPFFRAVDTVFKEILSQSHHEKAPHCCSQ